MLGTIIPQLTEACHGAKPIALLLKMSINKAFPDTPNWLIHDSKRLYYLKK